MSRYYSNDPVRDAANWHDDQEAIAETIESAEDAARKDFDRSIAQQGTANRAYACELVQANWDWPGIPESLIGALIDAAKSGHKGCADALALVREKYAEHHSYTYMADPDDCDPE